MPLGGESTGLTDLWEARALMVTASSLFEEVFLIHLYAVGEAYLAHFIGIRWLRGKVLGMFFCFIVFCIFAL